MASLDVYDLTKQKVGEIDLDERVFAVEVKEHLLHAAVRYQLNARRQGTHAVKRRSDVRGGGRKPFRQKGTGRARAGTSRAAQMRGGGVVFGPDPRDHGHKLNKKVRAEALRCALSARARDNAIVVLDAIEPPSAKTREIVDFMDRFELKDMLVVVPDVGEGVDRSTRNLQNVTVVPTVGLNVYDVLHRANLVMTRDAVDAVVARLGSS